MYDNVHTISQVILALSVHFHDVFNKRDCGEVTYLCYISFALLRKYIYYIRNTQGLIATAVSTNLCLSMVLSVRI